MIPFLLLQMATHTLWRNASAEDLENAAEGLEKYLMNKLYSVCFQPALSDDVFRDQVTRLSHRNIARLPPFVWFL